MFHWLHTFAIVFALASNAQAVSPDKYPDTWRGDGVSKTYVLYRKHDVRAMSQGNAPSCVGCAVEKAIELMHGKQFSAEWVYGKSRYQFNKSYGNGSTCAWAADVVRDIGAVPRQEYAIFGFDLSGYDPGLAYSWDRGPPIVLDWTAARYRSAGYVRITTFEELRDAIANEVPVVVGSGVGFGSRTGRVRTRDGMLHSKWWSRWSHAMVFCGVSDGTSKRALLLNSWGDHWIRGPKWLGDEPDGSFWVTKRDVEKMLRYGDCYAILPIVGLE